MSKLHYILATPIFLSTHALSGCSAAEPNATTTAPAPAPAVVSTTTVEATSTGEYSIPLPPALPKALQNVWPAEMEREFQARIKRNLQTLRAKSTPGKYGNTFFENEKKSYPNAMFDWMMGNRERAMKFLQEEDNNARQWNAHTEGIDLFPAFTLKGQVRKYFLWGEYLAPEYKERMKRAAQLWTEQDPLRRPHPNFAGKTGDGWTPEFKNSWVDVRNTDNLRAMRETSAYLFAEETGNEATRQLYKERIATWARKIHTVGMGEWDSENYLGHTFAPYLNLYDFAKDPEVLQLAKQVLDWTSAAAAMKYYRGGWAGPNKRDYGGANRPYGSGAARLYELYFGDNPNPDPDPEVDQVHVMTSRYRPPLAVMNLARKQFPKPVEVLAAKPTYGDYNSAGEQKPQYWETMYYGRTFQMGSVVSQGEVNDVGSFKLAAFSSSRGADFFLANSRPVIAHQGKWKGDQIGQFGNLVLWLRPAHGSPLFFLLPRDAAWEEQNGVWFVKMEKTWLAIRPIALAAPQELPILRTKKTKNQPDEQVPDEAYAAYKMLKSASGEGGMIGFALEVGEEPQSYDAFKTAVLQKGTLDLALLNQGVAKLTGSDGKSTLRLDHNQNDDLPLVHRNGKQREWNNELDVWKTVGDRPLISQKWGGGSLQINTPDASFSSSIEANETPAPKPAQQR